MQFLLYREDGNIVGTAILDQGCATFVRWRCYLGVCSMQLAVAHLSGAQNFKVAPGYLQNLCTSVTNNFS